MTRNLVPFPDTKRIDERIANILFRAVVKDFSWLHRSMLVRLIELIDEDIRDIAQRLHSWCGILFRVTHYFDIEENKKADSCWKILSEVGRGRSEYNHIPLKVSFSEFKKIYSDIYKQASALVDLSLLGCKCIIRQATNSLVLEDNINDLNYQLDRALAK